MAFPYNRTPVLRENMLVYPQDIGDENYVRQDFEEDNFVRQTRQLNKTSTITDDDDSSCYVQTCDQTISGRQLSYSRFGLNFSIKL